MRRNLFKYFKVFFILFLLLHPSILLSQEVFKQKEGFGYIYWEDIRAAREKAIKNALKEIVMDTVQETVESITFNKDREVLEERYSFNPEEYIKEYRILSEDMIEDVFIKVSLEAVVARDVLKNDLFNIGIHLGLIPRPRILIMMGEKNKEDAWLAFWWRPDKGPLFSLSSLIFTTELTEAGFDVIDPLVLPYKKDPDILMYRLKKDDIRKWGYIYGADMIVFGETKLDRLGNVLGSPEGLYRISTSAKIMDVSSGEEIFSQFIQKGFVIDNQNDVMLKKVLKRFSKKVVNGFVLKLIDSWKENEGITKSVEVLLKGVDSYDKYMDFKNALFDMKDRVIAIKEKRFSRGEVLMDVDIKGSPFFFKEDLQVLDMDGLSLILSFFSRERIDLMMVPE